jgi:hypothetical protein
MPTNDQLKAIKVRQRISNSLSIKYWKFICDNPDNPWDWNSISGNPNITWDIIRDNPDNPWDWDSISGNPNITWDIIRDNPDKPWGLGIYLW